MLQQINSLNQLKVTQKSYVEITSKLNEVTQDFSKYLEIINKQHKIVVKLGRILVEFTDQLK